MERLIFFLFILAFSFSIQAKLNWKALKVENDFKWRFPLVEVSPSPFKPVSEGSFNMIVHYKYTTLEYCGTILRAFLLFKGNTYIYLGSDYRYFYGQGENTIKNHFYIPKRLFNKDVDKLLIFLIYTVDPVHDQNRVITKWEYKLKNE